MNNIKHFFKATLLSIVLLVLNSSSIFAQSNWEVGIRFGDDIGIDATVPLSTKPRLHLATYFGNNFGSNFGLAGYFDWMFSLEGGPNGLKFYPGVGPEFYFGNDFDVGIAGDFGAEYSFDFPLTIGLDWRPGFMITDGMDFYSGNWGLIARFRFGEGVKFKAE